MQTRIKWHKLRDRVQATDPGEPSPLTSGESGDGRSDDNDGENGEGRDESLALLVFGVVFWPKQLWINHVWPRAFAAILILAAILALLITLVSPAHAFVNMKDANFTKSWIDLDASKANPELVIRRTYNSRSVRNGVFGFGWCADFESTLSRTANGALRLRECGAEGDSLFNLDLFSPTSSPLYRSDARPDEQISFDGNVYTRTKGAKPFQKFDRDGRLIEGGRDTTRVTYRYNSHGQISRIEAPDGKALIFHYSSVRLKKITGPDQLEATYKFDGENLVQVRNAYSNSYAHKYDHLHNLLLVSYPDGTEESLSYDEDRDWVTSYRGRDGCIESYRFQRHPDDPENAQVSTAIRKCGEKTTGEARFEFWYQTSSSSRKFLAKMRVERSGSRTEIVFHPISGKPMSEQKTTLHASKGSL